MKNEKQKEIRYFSMFTGVGGFELGFDNSRNNNRSNRERREFKGISPEFEESESSFTPVGFSEIDKYSNELLKQKFPSVKNWGDCTTINPSELPDFDMLCGGFPCQSFSIAGKRRGFEDTRGTMFFEIARILEVKRPRIVLLENVKGLLNHDKGKTFTKIIQTLEELGYRTQWMVLNSKFFGVPQNRERIFIIGSLRGQSRPEILPFREECKKDNELQGQPLSTNTLTGRYEATSTGSYISKSKFNAQEKMILDLYNKKAHTDRSPALTEPHHNNLRVAQPVQFVNKNRGKKPYDPNNREMKFKIRDDETSYTVKQTTHEFMVKENMKIRKLTPTECERLQGFPDGWTECFSDTQRYKMMGNAVTTNVIKAIGDKLI